MARSGFFRITWSLLAVAAGVLTFAAGSAFAAPFTIGNVFAGVGLGKIREYTPTGTLVQTLDTLSNSYEDTGMCFDGNTLTSNLRSTNFSNNSMSRIPQTGPVQYPWGSGFSADPESCVVSVDPNTNQTVVYVGQADGSRDVLKFDLTGAPLASYNVATENRGSDWIDLAADKCTLFYTSEGEDIKRYNVCTSTQLSNFATVPLGECYALRIRANGEVMVACTNQVYRLSPAGTLLQTYPKPITESSILFALNLDPSGTSFWTAGYATGNILPLRHHHRGCHHHVRGGVEHDAGWPGDLRRAGRQLALGPGDADALTEDEDEPRRDAALRNRDRDQRRRGPGRERNGSLLGHRLGHCEWLGANERQRRGPVLLHGPGVPGCRRDPRLR
jgi:hypothetical protein